MYAVIAGESRRSAAEARETLACRRLREEAVGTDNDMRSNSRTMSGWLVRASLIMVGLLVWGAAPAWAQNREKAWEVMPWLGQVRFGSLPKATDLPRTGDVVEIGYQDDLSYGFRFAYHWTKRHEIEFWLSSLSTKADTQWMGTRFNGTLMMDELRVKSIELRTDFVAANTNYIFNFFPHRRDKVVPFVTAGFGVLNLSTFGQTADQDLQELLLDLVGDENSLLLNYGGGIRFFGGERAGFRIDARRVHFSTDAAGNQDYLEFAVGVTLILGGA